MPWSGSNGDGRRASTGRTVGKLPRPATVRLSTRDAERPLRAFDAGGRGESDRAGHGVNYRISRLPAPRQNVASPNAAVGKRDALARAESLSAPPTHRVGGG